MDAPEDEDRPSKPLPKNRGRQRRGRASGTGTGRPRPGSLLHLEGIVGKTLGSWSREDFLTLLNGRGLSPAEWSLVLRRFYEVLCGADDCAPSAEGELPREPLTEEGLLAEWIDDVNCESRLTPEQKAETRAMLRAIWNDPNI